MFSFLYFSQESVEMRSIQQAMQVAHWREILKLGMERNDIELQVLYIIDLIRRSFYL